MLCVLNVSFSPNCIRRGSLAWDVTRPKLRSCTFVLFGLRIARLKALNASQRKSILNRSVKLKVFASEKFSARLASRRAGELRRGALPGRSLGCVTCPEALHVTKPHGLTK